MTKLLIIFCEGPHDAEFLALILKKVNGCDDYSNKNFEDYPSFFRDNLQNLIANSLKSLAIKNKNTFFSGTPIPIFLKKDDKTFVSIYSLHGDKAWDTRGKNISESFYDYVNSSTLIEKFGAIDISFALFYDADEKGVKNREEAARIDFLKVFKNEQESLNNLKHGEFIALPNTKLGLFIFTTADNNTGKLEHIVLPIMSENEGEKDNQSIVKGASDFIDNYHNESRQKANKKENQAGKFDKDKSIIGIIGQLQVSGVANTTIIPKTDYLSKAKLEVNLKSKEIADFFNKILIADENRK